MVIVIAIISCVFTGECLGGRYHSITKLSLVGLQVYFLLCAFLCLLIQILKLSVYYLYNLKMFQIFSVINVRHTS